MAKYTKMQTIEMMGVSGVIPVFYHKDVEVCKKIIKACYDGGIRVFEFTNRGDFAHEVFGELNKYVRQHLKGMTLGVGSIIDAESTAIYLQLGADFVVSPIVKREMAEICNRRKVAWIPGCGTVTEISYANELGAELIKIFPAAQIGGPEFVKSVMGPFPWVRIMPTGGVSTAKESLEKWFNAGVYCIGAGSTIFKKQEAGSYDFSAISKDITNILGIVAAIKERIKLEN